MARDASPVSVSAQDRAALQRLVRSGTAPYRLVLRSRIVLLASQGVGIRRTAAQLGVSAATVAVWRRRFIDLGLQALGHDAPGRGRKPAMAPEVVGRILEAYDSRQGHVSVRGLAATFGVSKSTIHRSLNLPRSQR